MPKPLYPYRLYVAGTPSFNNYFLFNHYLNQYKNDKTFLYSPKSSWLDIMSKLYATANSLCHLTCNVEKGISKYQNEEAVNFKIADTTDMLIAFWDGITPGVMSLKHAFDCKRKQAIVIDITGGDIILPGLVEKVEEGKPVISFSDVYQKYVDTKFTANTYTEQAMKFLIDAYNNPELMKLIIDNKDKEISVTDRLQMCIKAVIFWIYENQFDTLLDDYANLVPAFQEDRKKRSTLDEYKHAEKCEFKENGAGAPLYTGTGLPLSKGYNRVFTFGDKKYVEIRDNQIIREHVHKSMSSRLFTENEDDCNKVTYRTSDTESYPITYQVANFEASDFKMGYWYISTDFVTTVEPEKKKGLESIEPAE